MTLREWLPREFFLEYMDSRAAKLLDRTIVKEMKTNEVHWPGKEKNVNFFVMLDNGYFVGWNENPNKGWSFPVIKAK